MMFFSGEDQVSMPFILIIDGKSSCREVKIMLFKFLFPILKIPLKFLSKLDEYSGEEFYDKAYASIFEDSSFGHEELYEFLLINNRNSGEGCASWRKAHKGNCELNFQQKSYRSFLNHGQADPEVSIIWKMGTNANLLPFEKPIKVVLGEPIKSKEKKKIDLEMWLDSFRKEEILDGENKWYWGKCKEHVKARKKMDLYRLPPVLLIHLKRFLKNDHESSFFRNASRKITEVVDFPLRTLDLSEYIINDEEKKEGWIYDLYGVSNHMGKLHGGHYTASWYSTVHDKWLYFDDASVSKISEKDVVDPSAYILFYRRRGYLPH